MTLLLSPSAVRFGRGVLEETGREVLAAGGRSAVLVTTPGMRDRPVLRQVLDACGSVGVALRVHDRVPAEPGQRDLELAMAGCAGFDAAAVIGLGGGSAMDLAKLVAVLLRNPGPIDRYLGVGRVPEPPLPTVMIPTTAGSGSEVSQDAVLTDRKAGTKFAVKDRKIVPRTALIDPAATATCPPELTAASGADALVHAVEAYTGRRANPVSDMYARAAVELLWEHLPRAVADGGDLTAREHVALGATLAGMAFSCTGTAAVHACGYPLSGMFGIPHGVANGAMLPAVVAFNMAATAKYDGLSELLGADDLPAAFGGFLAGVGIPGRLRELGVPAEAIPRMAAVASGDRRHLDVNPREVAEADLEAIFRCAW